MSDLSHYFAALPADQIGKELLSRVTQYYSDPRVATILGCQRLAYLTEFTTGRSWWTNGPTGPGMAVSRGGEQGEQVLVHVNHFRALVGNIAARITNPKFIWQPQAAKWNSKSIRAVQVAKDALDHYWHNSNHESLRTLSVSHAAYLGEGLSHAWWDDYAGKEYARGPDNERVFTGDIRGEDILSWNAIRDPWRFPFDDGDWIILRLRRGKWDLAARYAHFYDQILAAPRIVQGWPSPMMDAAAGSIWTDDSADVLRFYHRKCAALPGGRDVTCLGDGTVIDFHDLEWDEIPVVRRTEGELDGTPYGYPSAWEIVNLQQLYDTLQSAVATNQVTFAGQLIGIKRGQNVNLMQLGSALSAIEVDDEKAVWPIQLTASPPEVFGHMESTIRNMERIMGASKISFGEAEGDRQSGSSQALLSAQLTENSSKFQTSDTKALTKWAGIVLNMLRVKGKKGIEIGRTMKTRASQGAALTVRPDDLKDVDRVFIGLGSPISQTTEGRIKALQVASTLPQVQNSITASNFWQIMETGRTEPVAESDVEQALLIQRENEMIMQGQMPPNPQTPDVAGLTVLITDDHFEHGREHTVTMSDPATRADGKAAESFTAHMLWHYSYAYNVPRWAIDPVTKQPVLDAQGKPVAGALMDPMYNARMQGLARGTPPQMTPPAAGGPSSGTPAPSGGSSTSSLPGNSDAGSAQLPEMPKNPKSGERYDPNARSVQ